MCMNLSDPLLIKITDFATAPPPGVAAPGTAPIPGAQQNNAQQPGFPAGFPPNFQPPANMPNINFSAPVIRLGTTGPAKPYTPMEGGRGERDGGGRRAGLGAGVGDQRSDRREAQAPLVPPTRDEIVRTMFVGGITEGAGGDVGIERILRAAGNLRKWTRATDADEKPCKFGFAEFEDPESLHTAVEILQDVEVPVKRQLPKAQGTNGETGQNGEEAEAEIEKSKLIVSSCGMRHVHKLTRLQIINDENTATYLQKWEDSQGGLDESHTEMRLDQARGALAAVLNDLFHPSGVPQKDEMSGIDRDGDTAMTGEANGDTAEVITIPMAIDDELSDIPAEMRETVAKEIAAFRDRSNRRDLERLRKEEEMESMERNRGSRNRLASPPPTAPTGPGGANGIPLGPRDKSIPNAPSGPKAFGQQIPRDYQKGVSFVNENGINVNQEDEDTDASDEELERRRKEKRDAEQEKHYLDQERRWLNRERSRTAAVEREKNRDVEEADRLGAEKEAMAKRLREWNDDAESSRKTEEYYADRSLWIRNRASFRSREAAADEADRAAESRENARNTQQRERAAGMADDFLSRQAEALGPEPQEELAPKAGPGRFKLSLGAAAAKVQDRANAVAATRTRRAAEAEGLLEDEEESATTTRRALIPIDPSAMASMPSGTDMTDEERAAAVRQLAADIPTTKEGLWGWNVSWDFVDESTITSVRPFVEKKIVEYLGVLEEMLVEVVEIHLRKRGGPGELASELADALGEEESETLVKKLWRMVIFFSESERRGLSG